MRSRLFNALSSGYFTARPVVPGRVSENPDISLRKSGDQLCGNPVWKSENGPKAV